MTKTKAETPIAGRMLATPQPGCVVRKPDGAQLPADGDAVNIDDNRTYWLRRIADGDVSVSPIADGDDA